MQHRSTPTRDAYAVITDRIIAALEAGTAPWRRPWNVAARGAMRNAVTGHVYRGINVPMLSFAASAAGYTDPRWLTFRQAKRAGGSVKKGEKGTPVVYWQWIEKKDAEEVARFPILRLYTAFNVAQCDGLDLEPVVTEPETSHDPIETAERMVAGYATGPKVERGGDRAYDRPSADIVRVPHHAAFENADGYYGTLFHELVHSTGHPSRLERFGSDAPLAPFGSADYSKEELVAEFGAAFLSGEAGIDTVEPSARYIASWLRVLRNDTRLCVHAAAAAQRAADHVLGRRVSDRSADPAPVK